MIRKATHPALTDIKQTAWQLSSIQLAGMLSLPVLVSSILILEKHDLFISLINIFIGNLVLWIIRFATLFISAKNRKSTLDLTFDFFGKLGAYIIAAALLADTLAWFVAQTTIGSHSLISLLGVKDTLSINRYLQISVFIGVISSLFCLEGIKLLKYLSLVSFPIIIVSFFGAVFSSQNTIINFSTNSQFSLSGLGLILGSNLGVSADLPTFFRHSYSWRDSMKALALIQIVSLIMSVGGLFLISIINSNQLFEGSVVVHGNLQKYLLIIYIFVSVICANVSNVYSASVGWELLAPKSLVGRKEYMILGMTLTILFFLIDDLYPINTLLEITDFSMVNLCMIFFLGFIIYLITGRGPNATEKWIYLSSWFAATIINFFQILNLISLKSYLLTSILIIVPCIVIGSFIESLRIKIKN